MGIEGQNRLFVFSILGVILILIRYIQYHPRFDMAYGRLKTPAPTMAVTLWKAAYHHFAFLDPVIGSHASMAFCSSVLSSCCKKGTN